MGLIDRLFSILFGNGANVVRETAEVFRENAEAGAARDARLRADALAQLGAEFTTPKKGMFDRFMDGINRIPRPAMALGTLGLFVAAMVDPVWFGARMQGLVLVPEPLWWLMGAVVSFYFGARYQAKGQEFQRSIAETMLRVPQVAENLSRLKAAEEAALWKSLAESGAEGPNPALAAWKKAERRRAQKE